MKLSERIEKDRQKELMKRQRMLDRNLALGYKPLGWLERLHWRRYIRKNTTDGWADIKATNLKFAKYSFSNKFYKNEIDYTRVKSLGKWLAEEGLYFKCEGSTNIMVLTLESVEDFKRYGNVYVNENNCICIGEQPEGPGNWKMIFEKTTEEKL